VELNELKKLVQNLSAQVAELKSHKPVRTNDVLQWRENLLKGIPVGPKDYDRLQVYGYVYKADQPDNYEKSSMLRALCATLYNISGDWKRIETVQIRSTWITYIDLLVFTAMGTKLTVLDPHVVISLGDYHWGIRGQLKTNIAIVFDVQDRYRFGTGTIWWYPKHSKTLVVRHPNGIDEEYDDLPYFYQKAHRLKEVSTKDTVVLVNDAKRANHRLRLKATNIRLPYMWRSFLYNTLGHIPGISRLWPVGNTVSISATAARLVSGFQYRGANYNVVSSELKKLAVFDEDNSDYFREFPGARKELWEDFYKCIAANQWHRSTNFRRITEHSDVMNVNQNYSPSSVWKYELGGALFAVSALGFGLSRFKLKPNIAPANVMQIFSSDTIRSVVANVVFAPVVEETLRFAAASTGWIGFLLHAGVVIAERVQAYVYAQPVIGTVPAADIAVNGGILHFLNFGLFKLLGAKAFPLTIGLHSAFNLIGHCSFATAEQPVIQAANLCRHGLAFLTAGLTLYGLYKYLKEKSDEVEWDVTENLVAARDGEFPIDTPEGIYRGVNTSVPRRKTANPVLQYTHSCRFKTTIRNDWIDNFSDSYFTRFWGYPFGDMPAKNNEIAFRACLRLVQFSPHIEEAFRTTQPPLARKIQKKIRTEKFGLKHECVAVDHLDVELMNVYLEHLRTDNPKRYKAIVLGLTEDLVLKDKTSLFAKGDECQLRYSLVEKDGVVMLVQEFKPRPIHDVATPWLKVLGPVVYHFQQKLKKQWNGLDITAIKGDVEYYVCYSASDPVLLGRVLDNWERNIPIPGTRVLIFVCGDDTACLISINGGSHVFQLETDFKNYDASQGLEILRIAFEVYRKEGMPEEAIYYLECLANNQLVMQDQALRVDGPIFTAKGPHRDTGGADTSLSNSVISAILMIYCLDLALHQDLNLLNETVCTKMAELGMELKYRELPQIDPNRIDYHFTFLKGWFMRDVAGRNIWVPLPSRLLKVGIFKRPLRFQFDIPRIRKVTDNVELMCQKLRLWQITTQYAPFAELPLFGAFIKAFGICPIETPEKYIYESDKLMYFQWDPENYREVRFDTDYALRKIIERYDLTQGDIRSLEKFIERSQANTIVYSRVWISLLSDY
jgi:hypothetical protein